MDRVAPKVGELKLLCIRPENYMCVSFFSAFMHYYDDPKGSIPSMLINWAARSGVPDFLSKMEVACNQYKDYKAAQ